tara:strand:- start:178 stop:624 length:447 start_codon:yes stop_codon:yes gene_type:complete
MNIDELKKEIEADEGVKYEIYLDHLGYPTVGCGHLIQPDDEEYGKEVGTTITEARCSTLFASDIDGVLADCGRLYATFSDLPEEAQKIIANMMFNMGLTRLSKFKKMKAAIEKSDFKEAANQMHDSKWRTQVPNRAERLINRMRNIKV